MTSINYSYGAAAVSHNHLTFPFGDRELKMLQKTSDFTICNYTCR